LGAKNILANGGLRLVFTTASLSVATASTGVSPAVATVSVSFLTAAIFTTVSVATPTIRVTRASRGVVIGSSNLSISVNISSISKKDKGKGKMTEPEDLSKEKRDYEIARIHAKRELEMMITELDMSSEMVAKYLRIQLDKESFKKLKTAEALGTEPTQKQQFKEPKELSEEELKKMMDLVPLEELYIKTLQRSTMGSSKGTSDLYASGERLSIDKRTHNFDAVKQASSGPIFRNG
nr:hypothetical protein [Tanacetum cinerariifolium]